MNSGQGHISLPPQAELIIDPDQWILMDTPMITGIQNQSITNVPKVFKLHQNYPNPFNPSTIIKYELPITSYVELNIYTLLGQRVATLVNKVKEAGFHQVEWDATGFSSGVYYYMINTGEFQEVKKMILVR